MVLHDVDATVAAMVLILRYTWCSRIPLDAMVLLASNTPWVPVSVTRHQEVDGMGFLRPRMVPQTRDRRHADQIFPYVLIWLSCGCNKPRA